MIDIWKRKPGILSPIKYPVPPEALLKASQIPGAKVAEEGYVEGPNDALNAVKAWVEGYQMQLLDLPSGTQAPPSLPPFQKVGSSFIALGLQTGTINHDDMGLGKTVQTIAALAPDPKTAKVVLCPAFLKRQWESEIKRWSKALHDYEPVVHVLKPASQVRKSDPAPTSRPEWIIAFYTDAERAFNLVGTRSFILVIDEIHNLRGYKSKRLNAVKRMSVFAQGRVGLTGSLLYNDGAGLHPILDLVAPGAFGSFYDFAKRYASGFDGPHGFVTGALKHQEELRARLSYYMIRRSRQDVADQLPFESKYQTIWLDPPAGHTVALKAEAFKQGGSYLSMLAHHRTAAVVESVANDLDQGLPCLVFTFLREQATEISRALPGSLLVLGGAQSTQRLADIDLYVQRCKVENRTACVVGTYGALGEGANLQWAKVVTLAALTYTPDEVRQAVARAARMGRVGDLIVRVFAVKQSIDEHLVSVLRRKLEEQFALDGRKEKGKADLHEALGPTESIAQALRRIYDKAVASEATKNDGDPSNHEA